MGQVKSGASADLWTIDPVSNAGRVSLYDDLGVYRGPKGTYGAATAASLVTAATATSFFTIGPSADKLIRIWRVVVSGFTQAAVGYNSVLAKMMSTAPVGAGTDLVQTPHNSALAAGGVSLCRVYTVAPVDGTLIGDIAARRFLSQATVAAAAGIPFVADFDWRLGDEADAPVLNAGSTEHFGCHLATGVIVTADVDVLWTYE